MTDTFHFLGEPLLQFGHEQDRRRPHDGLALFGPAEPREAMPDHIVMGNAEGVALWKEGVVCVAQCACGVRRSGASSRLAAVSRFRCRLWRQMAPTVAELRPMKP